jgi:hypothetical protein
MVRNHTVTLSLSYVLRAVCSKLFTVLNNTDNLFSYFRKLGLSTDEAKVYIELLKGPSTPSKISQNTGVNRTRIYRVAELLEKRSLVTKQSDENGAFLAASDPGLLQANLISREEKIKQQRQTLNELIPALEAIRAGETAKFVVHTYDGVEGFKQMLWHELKARGECLNFGYGEMEKLVPDRRWAEKQRALSIEAGYTIREILNPDGKRPDFTDHAEFAATYQRRIIPEDVLRIRQQTLIYNDTVAIYNWANGVKVGTEIVSHEYANMLRQIFEYYWSVAKVG